MTETIELLSLINTSIGYTDLKLVDNLTLTIHPGEFWSIVGSNGTGKTTLVRTLIGLLKPLSGKRKTATNLKLGYVPQKNKADISFPLKAYDVVELGLSAQNGIFSSRKTTDDAQVYNALAMVDAHGFSAQAFHKLSGGQQQRILLARALVCKPQVLILDEPAAGLDIVAEEHLFDLLQKLKKTLNLAIVMVTHDLNVAGRLSSQLVILNGLDRVASVGNAREILTSERLTQFFRRPVFVREHEGHWHVSVEKI